MLTYALEKNGSGSLYTQLSGCIRRDILSGALPPRQKLPSKRALAQHLEVSVITVKNAYEQLAAEGYIYTVEKKGYYVSPVERPLPPADPPPLTPEKPAEPVFLDLATGSLDRSYFPFTVWSRLMRQTILEEDTELLRAAPSNGAPALRRAIAAHLRQFRGMDVDPEQISVGAGTELLYTLIIQLLGREKRYAVEDPGYGKIARIYLAHQGPLCRVRLDSGGLDVAQLRRQPADVVHISPSHHYPTGIVMPIARRQELLRWAAEQPERYILEDDYDSELRHQGLPVPPLFSLDGQGRVLYLSTFSQTIAPSLRIAYLCLPPRLMERLRTQLGFYACAVPSFEQFTLARFIASGDYERHLNRLRKRFREKRAAILAAITASPLAQRCEIIEENAGTHFLLRLATSRSDAELKRSAAERGLSLRFLSDYRSDGKNSGCAIVNYACMPTERLPAALETLAELL